MRDKYVYERFSYYFSFGQHSDGRVDIASTHHDTVATVDPGQVPLVIADRAKVIDAMIQMANAFERADQEAFDKFWYEDLK